MLISFPLCRWKHGGLERSRNLLRITGLRSCSSRMQTFGCLLPGCVKDCTSFPCMPVQGRTVLLTPPLSTTGSAGKFKSNFQSHFPSVLTCTNQWGYSLESSTLEVTPLMFSKVERNFVRTSFFFIFLRFTLVWAILLVSFTENQLSSDSIPNDNKISSTIVYRERFVFLIPVWFWKFAYWILNRIFSN